MGSLKLMESPRAIGEYTAAEVSRLAGVSSRRIGSWARYGIVPSISEKPKIYSYADVGEAILAHFLVDLGWKPKRVRELVERLRLNTVRGRLPVLLLSTTEGWSSSTSVASCTSTRWTASSTP